jgi:hypothetical protein
MTGKSFIERNIRKIPRKLFSFQEDKKYYKYSILFASGDNFWHKI